MAGFDSHRSWANSSFSWFPSATPSELTPQSSEEQSIRRRSSRWRFALDKPGEKSITLIEAPTAVVSGMIRSDDGKPVEGLARAGDYVSGTRQLQRRIE